MPTGEVIDVVIVDDHHAIRSGMTALLADDQRLRVTGTAARIAELRTSGLSYEACILELAGIGEAKEIADLIGEVPAVVCTAAEHWRYRVTAWTCGAKGVLGKNTGAVPLADAVWHAVHRPHNIQAQLARA